jgi:hypothetical protein
VKTEGVVGVEGGLPGQFALQRVLDLKVVRVLDVPQVFLVKISCVPWF